MGNSPRRCILSGVAICAAYGAWAQEPPPAAAADEAPALEVVVVTGSRIGREEIEGPAPVTIFTSEQMAREGFTTVYEALYSLTQQTGAGLQTQFSPNGATANATNIDLRGLGPGRVLILFNGRRAADYPLPFNGQSNIVNLSSLPTAAVERVEVLAGGASAIYGSDAVSGVVNIVMRDEFEGTAISARLGGTTQGGGETRRLQLTGGTSGDAFKAVYALEYFDREPIWALDREDFDSLSDDPTGNGLDNTIASAMIAPFSPLTGGTTLVDPTAPGCASFGREVNRTTLPPATGFICGSPDWVAQQTIRHDTRDVSGFFNSSYDFGGLELFGTLSLWQSESAFNPQQPVWIGDFVFDATPGAGNDFGFTGGQYVIPVRLFQINENDADLALRFDERAWDAAIGLRGELFGERVGWEIAYHHAHYTVERDQRLLLDAPLNDFYFGPQVGVDPLFRAFPAHQVRRDRIFRALTPAEYASITAINHTEADSSNDQVNAVATGELFDLPAGAAKFAAVLEWGTQDYTIDLDPRAVAGEFLGFTTQFPGGGERDRYAAGVELALPVHDKVRLTLASRYDKYDDITEVDDAVTYNAGLEYRPGGGLLLRGSFATSFRAPDMHFVFAGPSSLFAQPLDELRCRRDQRVTDLSQCTLRPVIVDSTRRGNPGLREETGESFTAGMVWRIGESFDLSLDYFDIELEDLVNDMSFGFILETEADCVLGRTKAGAAVDSSSALCRFVRSQIVRGPDVTGSVPDVLRSVNTAPINRALQGVNGLDASLNYRLPTARFGDFRFNLAWSHVLEEERQEFAEDPVDSYRDDPDNLDLRSRLRGSVSWAIGNWSQTLFADRRGSRPTFDDLSRTESFTTYNYSASYSPTERLGLSLVVDNLFDEDPRIDDTFSAYPFFWQSNINPVGREIFAEVSYSFR